MPEFRDMLASEYGNISGEFSTARRQAFPDSESGFPQVRLPRSREDRFDQRVPCRPLRLQVPADDPRTRFALLALLPR